MSQPPHSWNWNAIAAIGAIGSVVSALLGAMIVATRKLFASVTPEQMTTAINNAMATSNKLVDERHIENQRRAGAQDATLARIEVLIRDNDTDARQTRDGIRTDLSSVASSVAVLQTQMTAVQTQVGKLEESAKDKRGGKK